MVVKGIELAEFRLHFGFISALLLLVKLSFGAESFICLLLLLVYYGVKKDVRACIVLAWSFFVSFVLLYMMSGQRLADIIYYPVNIYYGISGYTDAISFPASTRPVVSAAVFLVIFLAYFACTGIKHFSLQKVCCVCVLAILSLVNFKHGFIRNGYGHTVDVYLLQWFLFIYILHVMGRSVIKNVLITACTMSLFVLGAEDYPYFFKGAQIRDAINGLQAKTGDAYRLFSEEQNGRDYRHHINSIRSAFPLPALKGTSDIYNFDQAVLIASDNIWNPRPAFQSYQAVTPYLANINYEHLL